MKSQDLAAQNGRSRRVVRLLQIRFVQHTRRVRLRASEVELEAVLTAASVKRIIAMTIVSPVEQRGAPYKYAHLTWFIYSGFRS
jgi:hypothetical protein